MNDDEPQEAGRSQDERYEAPEVEEIASPDGPSVTAAGVTTETGAE